VASTASDRDPGDAIVAHAWSVSPTASGCAADVEGADTSTLLVVFWCAGTYEVALTATDSAGATSAPVRRTIAVTQLVGAPTVTAGADVAVDHLCAGSPLQCQLAQPVALTASGQAGSGGGLAYEWKALAPEANRAGASALFTPSGAAPSPSLQLVTGGGPISGAWRLRVRVRDADGNLAQAFQTVAVGNRPPQIDASALELDHRYLAGTYQAGGTVALPMIDPDGDPVEGAVQLVEPAGSGCSGGFTAVAPGSWQLALSCPGPGGLMSAGRVLRATATDANGAMAAAEVAVRILNRVPVVRPAAGPGATEVSVDHSVGPCPGGSGLCFQAAGAGAFVVEDPDGDPVTEVTLFPEVDPSRALSTGETRLGGAPGTFRFSTPISSPAEFRAADGTSGFRLTATASDPFGASAPAHLAIRIGNRPPALTSGVPAISVGHRWDPASKAYWAEAALATFEDPDGDPLLDAGGGDADCAFTLVGGAVTATCRRHYDPAGNGFPPLAGFAGLHSLVPAVSDGWASTSSASQLTVTNTPPEVPAFAGGIEGCFCHCDIPDNEFPGQCAVPRYWVVNPFNATFLTHPVDADGDPLSVTFTSVASLSPTSLVAPPDQCTTVVKGGTYPVLVQVVATDGLSQASASWTGVKAFCSRAGQPCD
jgi:hypothetical protein